jgi:type IV pilus assembly protein PilA
MILDKKLRLTKNQKGMTLIELMAVVVILGILAAVAGAAVVGGFDKSKTNADATSVKIIQDAAQRYVMDKNVADGNLTADVTVGKLVAEGYLSSEPVSSVDSIKPHFALSTSKTAGKYTFSVTTQSAAQP